MKIVIQTIPQSEQRYNTTGDYWTDADGTVYITVTDMGDTDAEFLVALHEMVEQYLCTRRGISDESITAFDLEFEKTAGPTDEPGDSPNAPYQNEHNFATGIERLMCSALGVKWNDYEQLVYKYGK